MTQPTFVGGVASENGASTTVTYSIDFSTIAVQDGDYVFFVGVCDATAVHYDATTYNAEAWTLLATAAALGSRSGQVYGRVWHTGNAKTFQYRKDRANADGLAIAVYRGVSAVGPIGTGKSRGTAPVDAATQTTALGITTTTADSWALAVLMEATSAAESGSFLTGPTMPSGWTQDFYRAQTGTINTIAFAHKPMPTAGATGDATFTYQNTQASNGWGIQIGLQGVVAGTPPTADFTSAADDLSVQFTDASTGTVTSRSWDFGDGQTSSATSPKHLYGSPGTYTVKLTVTDGTTPNTKPRTVTIDGVSVSYWDGAAWHEDHLSKWDGTTEKGISELVALPGVSLNWPQMKALHAADPTFPLDAIHRGGSLNYVEFSTDGFQAAAIRWPRKAHELSVRWSADNHPWLIHDTTLDRTVLQVSSGSTLPIASLTDAQIATYTQSAWQTNNTQAPRRPLMPLVPIASLPGVVSWMELYGQKRVAFIEDKTYSHTDALLAIMDANGGPNWFVWKQSGEGTLFSQVAAKGYDSWGYLFDDQMSTYFASKQAQWTFIGLDWHSSDATLDPAIATAGPGRVIMHIVGDAAQASRLRGKGVAGLMISGPREVAPYIM